MRTRFQAQRMASMFRPLALLLALATLATPRALWAQDKATTEDIPLRPALFDQVQPMMKALSEITGWKVKRYVPSELLSKKEFAAMVNEGVEESEKSEKVRAVELTLKMFGLTPWDYNFAQASADLIEEQAAAFYDFDKKRLFVLESTPDGLAQRVALVHELAHALADQQHSLEDYIDDADSDDESTARQAVVEGQANWLSFAYLSYTMQGIPEVPKLALDALADAAGATGEEFPVLSAAPLYMRESLIFPYSEGMRFQDAVYRELGPDAFEQIFDDPPQSTHDILHPDEYATRGKPEHPKIPRLRDYIGRDEKKALKELDKGDVGEFDYLILLRQYLTEPALADPEFDKLLAARLAASAPDGEVTENTVTEEDLRALVSSWRGASFRLYEHKANYDPEKSPLLVHYSEWASPEAAAEFFELYKKVLAAKWDHMVTSTESTDRITGTGDTGDFLVQKEGAFVLSIEGIHPPRPRPE